MSQGEESYIEKAKRVLLGTKVQGPAIWRGRGMLAGVAAGLLAWTFSPFYFLRHMDYQLPGGGLLAAVISGTYAGWRIGKEIDCRQNAWRTDYQNLHMEKFGTAPVSTLRNRREAADWHLATGTAMQYSDVTLAHKHYVIAVQVDPSHQAAKQQLYTFTQWMNSQAARMPVQQPFYPQYQQTQQFQQPAYQPQYRPQHPQQPQRAPQRGSDWISDIKLK